VRARLPYLLASSIPRPASPLSSRLPLPRSPFSPTAAFVPPLFPHLQPRGAPFFCRSLLPFFLVSSLVSNLSSPLHSSLPSFLSSAGSGRRLPLPFFSSALALSISPYSLLLSLSSSFPSSLRPTSRAGRSPESSRCLGRARAGCGDSAAGRSPQLLRRSSTCPVPRRLSEHMFAFFAFPPAPVFFLRTAFASCGLWRACSFPSRKRSIAWSRAMTRYRPDPILFANLLS